VKRVLVIDDERAIRRLLRISLEQRRYEVFEAATGFEGLQELRAVRPDIVLLDLNLPDTAGAAVLAEIRKWSAVPVIVVSVKNAEEDVVNLLNAGADDYLTKPFSTAELAARMNVALRNRPPGPGATAFTSGRLSVDFEARRVTVDGADIKLTPTEYGILSLLARHAGGIVTQETLLRELWGPLSDAESGNLRVHVSSLRKKIEKDPARPEFLLTEPGIGYRLAAKDKE
jgi:two-component system KDP operon response regulator KdpE